MVSRSRLGTGATVSAVGNAGESVDDIVVGIVQGPWGVRGEVKVLPQSSDAAALLKAKGWRLRTLASGAKPEALADYAVRARRHGTAVVAQLEGVDDRDVAQALVGAQVLVSRASFPVVGQDEYYWVDLVGCAVVNRQQQPLGTVVGLIDTGVHSVLRLALGTEDSPTEERLVPFVAAYVDSVELDARLIRVDWGLDY